MTVSEGVYHSCGGPQAVKPGGAFKSVCIYKVAGFVQNTTGMAGIDYYCNFIMTGCKRCKGAMGWVWWESKRRVSAIFVSWPCQLFTTFFVTKTPVCCSQILLLQLLSGQLVDVDVDCSVVKNVHIQCHRGRSLVML